MAIGRAQVRSAQSGGLAYTSAVTVGSLLVAVVNVIRQTTQGTVSAVSDSVNGAWTEAASVQYTTSGWLNEVSLWYRANTGAGTPTVTPTFTGLTTCMSLAEYTGMPTTATLDGTATTTGNTASTSHTTGNATTTTADLLLGAAGDWGDNDVYTAGSGWTKATAFESSGNIQCFLEDQGVGTTGVVAGTYAASYTTAASSNAAGVFATFNAGAAAAPPPAAPVVAPSLAAISRSSTW